MDLKKNCQTAWKITSFFFSVVVVSCRIIKHFCYFSFFFLYFILNINLFYKAQKQTKIQHSSSHGLHVLPGLSNTKNHNVTVGSSSSLEEPASVGSNSESLFDYSLIWKTKCNGNNGELVDGWLLKQLNYECPDIHVQR